MSVDYVVCVATEMESRRIERSLGGNVVLLQTGIGPVNAAYTLTRFLAGTRVGGVIVCGVGGAYPGSGLEVGDVVCASSEMFGDLGADSPTGFLDLEALGFAPADLDLQIFPCERRAPFVTVSTCTGTDERAHALETRTGGAVESMEGAAVVHVANREGVPVGQIRGISNHVGNRDRAAWRLQEAAEAAQAALLEWL